MRKIKIELEDELYEWVKQQADKVNLPAAQMITLIVEARQTQLRKWTNQWHDRMSDPWRAYKERERIRLAQKKLREARRQDDAKV